MRAYCQFDHNTKRFIYEGAFQNVVWEMAGGGGGGGGGGGLVKISFRFSRAQ